MNLKRLSPAACLCSLLFISSVPAAQDGAERQPENRGATPRRVMPEQKLLTVDFPGGTVADYIEAVRKAAGDVNVVIMGNVRDIPMLAVRLTAVDAQSALQVLNEIPRNQKGRVVEVRVGHEPPNSADEMPMFTVHSTLEAKEPSQSVHSMVFAVADVLHDNIKPDDLLTAVQTGLDLLGEEYQPAQIRFHEATALLIARGHPNQVSAVNDIVKEMRENIVRRQQAQQQDVQNLRYQNQVLRQESEMLRQENQALRQTAERLENDILRLKGEGKKTQ
jgi:hypothetical protein